MSDESQRRRAERNVLRALAQNPLDAWPQCCMLRDADFQEYGSLFSALKTLITSYIGDNRSPVINEYVLAQAAADFSINPADIGPLFEVAHYSTFAEGLLTVRQRAATLDELTRQGRVASHCQRIAEQSLGLIVETAGIERFETKTAWDAVNHPAKLRECVIEGLARRGEVVNAVAATKIGKSWLALGLLFSVSTGRDWLNRRVLKGNVLLLDNELHDETIQNRTYAVATALKLEPSKLHSRFDYIPLRGESVNIAEIQDILSKYQPGDLTLVVLDAKYKFFAFGKQENSNDDQTEFHNAIDRLARQLDCVIVLVHHSTKGDQGGKGVTDVGSGGGSQARAVDCHMVIRPHAEPGLAVLDAAVRTFAPVEPQTIRWDFPLWTVADGVQPILKQDKTRSDRTDEMRTRILTHLSNEWQSVSALADRCSTQKGRQPFADIIDKLQGEGIADIRDDFIPKNMKKQTIGIRLTSDKTTSDTVGGSLSEVSG